MAERHLAPAQRRRLATSINRKTKARVSARKTLTLALALSLMGGAASAAPADSVLDQNAARTELAREEMIRREEAARKNEQAVRPDRIRVRVASVTVTGNQDMSEARIRSLIPELKKETVSIHRLSRQIQFVNDSGAVHLHADFRPAADGAFDVVVACAEEKPDSVSLRVSNTGNEYSGDWRATLSYINNNISGFSDTLGLAYVTSPDDHFSDVQQAAVSYRRILPEHTAALVFSASYSDVDLGNVSPDSIRGILDYTAAGKGLNIGAHYQQNIAYTSREKDLWDFGIDYQKSKSEYGYKFHTAGTPFTDSWEQDYSLLLASANFVHNDRSNRHSFTYDAGVSTNLSGDKKDYEAATPGSDRHFLLFKAGASYQYRLPSDWIFGARAHGQYTGQHVVSLAQIGAGGMYSVRGFDERAVSADTGLVGSLEIYTPHFLKNSRFVLFADYGNLTNNTGHSTTSFHSETLGSVGIGYRYTDRKNGITLALDYAKITDDVSIDSQKGHRRWNASFSISF